MTLPFCAAVDWGTTSFRLWLLARDGAILGERRSREGMQAAAEPGFAPVLEAHLSAVGADAALPVIVCGMAGARQGWVEVPYVDAPAAFDDIAGHAMEVPGIARRVRILPGVAQKAAGRADVMRGEETQAMGLSLGREALLCLPGTHSKWVEVSGPGIAGFSTFMTGEIFALLANQSILRHAIDADADISAAPEAFAGGVEASLAEPAAILNRLFSLRAAGLFGEATPARAAARLSGLLLGLEIAGARALLPGRSAVVLAASGPLLGLYRAALRIAGFDVTEKDADSAVREGLLSAARLCFDETQGRPT